jgi:putative flippase GtrA
MTPPATIAHTGRRHARRFVKYCIVGASSTAIMMVVVEMVVRLAHSESLGVVRTGNALGFLLAVTNGYYWNRRWTFRQSGAASASQYAKFVGVNLVGLTLNQALVTLFYGHLNLFRSFPKPYLLATLAAVVCVTLWNFTANSLWTFRRHHA